MAMPEVKHPAGFPACINLSIEFNVHAVYYMTVEQWIEDDQQGQQMSWVSDEEKRLAIDTNSVWICQWYPKTPIGSYSVAASSYEALMAFVGKQEA